jgi:hypothetical protein
MRCVSTDENRMFVSWNHRLSPTSEMAKSPPARVSRCANPASRDVRRVSPRQRRRKVDDRLATRRHLRHDESDIRERHRLPAQHEVELVGVVHVAPVARGLRARHPDVRVLEPDRVARELERANEVVDNRRGRMEGQGGDRQLGDIEPAEPSCQGARGRRYGISPLKLRNSMIFW